MNRPHPPPARDLDRRACAMRGSRARAAEAGRSRSPPPARASPAAGSRATASAPPATDTLPATPCPHPAAVNRYHPPLRGTHAQARAAGHRPVRLGGGGHRLVLRQHLPRPAGERPVRGLHQHGPVHRGHERARPPPAALGDPGRRHHRGLLPRHDARRPREGPRHRDDVHASATTACSSPWGWASASGAWRCGSTSSASASRAATRSSPGPRPSARSSRRTSCRPSSPSCRRRSSRTSSSTRSPTSSTWSRPTRPRPRACWRASSSTCARRCRACARTRPPSGREVDMAKAFLDIHRMRMGSRLDYVLEVPENLRCRPFPPMMLITLVENAVKHGVDPCCEAGTITIRASEEGGKLRFSVADTGEGISPKKGTGRGPRQHPRAAEGALRHGRAPRPRGERAARRGGDHRGRHGPAGRGAAPVAGAGARPRHDPRMPHAAHVRHRRHRGRRAAPAGAAARAARRGSGRSSPSSTRWRTAATSTRCSPRTPRASSSSTSTCPA